MPGCAKHRKAVCLENDECIWIVGKGCRENKERNPTKLKTTLKPQNVTASKFHLNQAFVKKIFSQVHPDYRLSGEVIVFLERILKQLFDNMFGNAATETYTQKTLETLLVNNLQSRKIANKAKHDATKQLEYLKAIKQKPTQASFLNVNGNKIQLFSEDVKLYFTAVVEYFLALLLDRGGNITHSKKRKTVTIEHITEAIRKDADLIDFAKSLTKTKTE